MALSRTISSTRIRTVFSGTGADDNDVLLTITEAWQYDTFVLMSSAGAVDVQVTLNGTDWSTAALSLTDLGAVSVDPVLVTVADRVYGFRGMFEGVRVLQNGATASVADIVCGSM